MNACFQNNNYMISLECLFHSMSLQYLTRCMNLCWCVQPPCSVKLAYPTLHPLQKTWNIKGMCVSKGCTKWTCPIHHTSDFHDGCPRKCFNHFLKDTSFYVCFYIRSPMGSTLPLPHVGSAADSHSPSYAPILKPSAVLIPPLDLPQNLPHHFLLMWQSALPSNHAWLQITPSVFSLYIVTNQHSHNNVMQAASLCCFRIK